MEILSVGIGIGIDTQDSEKVCHSKANLQNAGLQAGGALNN